jgi:hypothetical protein
MGTKVRRRALEAGVSEISNEHESYPGSGISEEITPLVLLCRGLRMMTMINLTATSLLLELFARGRRRARLAQVLL